MPTRSFVYSFGNVTYDFSSRTHIMGVLNVTPDSFSDGGKYADPQRALDRAMQMVEEGVDIIDVGGESTRPKSATYGEGADPVPVDEELRRVIPVISLIAQKTKVPISVDTYKARVAQEALAAGATIVNDISGFHFDEKMAETVAHAGASAILMHIRGVPKTMQQNTSYTNLLAEVKSYLAEAIRRAQTAGVCQILVDPGIGFGKTTNHNLLLLNNLEFFSSLGYPLVVGVSRKSFIGTLLDRSVRERLYGSIGGTVAAIFRGANLIRTHDVRETREAVVIADAIRYSRED